MISGNRGGKTSKEAEEEIEERPRTNLNGGDLVQSTFVVLTFAFALAFMTIFVLTFVLAFVLAFLSPFGGKVLTCLRCNSEKRGILDRGGVIPFGAFGWAFARAHCDLRRGFAFHWSLLKAAIDCARRGSRGWRTP